MKKTEFLASLNFLSQKLTSINLNLGFLFKAIKENSLEESRCEQTIQEVEEVKNLINQLVDINIIILIDQDYTNFCLLILYGSLMAEHLTKMKRVSRKTVKVMHNWWQLEKIFKHLLEENIIFSSVNNNKN